MGLVGLIPQKTPSTSLGAGPSIGLNFCDDDGLPTLGESARRRVGVSTPPAGSSAARGSGAAAVASGEEQLQRSCSHHHRDARTYEYEIMHENPCGADPACGGGASGSGGGHADGAGTRASGRTIGNIERLDDDGGRPPKRWRGDDAHPGPSSASLVRRRQSTANTVEHSYSPMATRAQLLDSLQRGAITRGEGTVTHSSAVKAAGGAGDHHHPGHGLHQRDRGAHRRDLLSVLRGCDRQEERRQLGGSSDGAGRGVGNVDGLEVVRGSQRVYLPRRGAAHGTNNPSPSCDRPSLHVVADTRPSGACEHQRFEDGRSEGNRSSGWVPANARALHRRPELQRVPADAADVLVEPRGHRRVPRGHRLPPRGEAVGRGGDDSCSGAPEAEPPPPPRTSSSSRSAADDFTSAGASAAAADLPASVWRETSRTTYAMDQQLVHEIQGPLTSPGAQRIAEGTATSGACDGDAIHIHGPERGLGPLGDDEGGSRAGRRPVNRCGPHNAAATSHAALRAAWHGVDKCNGGAVGAEGG